VQEPLRDDAGKVRRNALRQERIERGQQARQPHQSQQGAQQ